jgi:hypothetical protein
MSELDPGRVPLISCGETDNGLVGYFDIGAEFIYQRALTVAYNGQPLTTKFHPYKFAAKDDVAVLLPRHKMQDATLLYMAAMLNRMIWRYSYGRKCFREKLRQVNILVPLKDGNLDEQLIAQLSPPNLRQFWTSIRNATSKLRATT